MGCSPYKTVVIALGGLVFSGIALAQSPPRFDISGFAVEGAPLLKSEDFSSIISPFLGKQKSATDVVAAQRALQQAYFDLGHCSVQVTAARSDSDAKLVIFRLTQASQPATKDCLPVVALDDGRVATRAEVLPRTLAVAQESPSARTAPLAPAEKAAPPARAPQVVAQVAQSKPVPAVSKPATRPPPIVVRASESAGAAPAAPSSGDASLRFDIDSYLIEGNTLLNAEVVIAALRRFVGKQKDFADVQRALEALQVAYQESGYGAVQVTLPEQELNRGEVRFEVVETRVGRVIVEGNVNFNERNIRNSLPGLKEGTTPNSDAIARSLKIANESPVKQTQVSLRAGSKDGEVDATVKVVDDSPVKRSVAFDNTGTSNTGRFRLGLGIQHANMFNRDHVATLQYITNPEHPSTVAVFGLGYRIPLYAFGDSIDMVAGYSDVTSGTVKDLFAVAGAGTVFALRYNRQLDRIGNYEHKVTVGLDYKAFRNNVTFIGSTVALVPDITVHPASITYSGAWRGEEREFGVVASYSQNIFPGGNDGAGSDFRGPSQGFPDGARFNAKAGYSIVRVGANFATSLFGKWQLRYQFTSQFTDAALIAGEQFGLGGADNVRGFDERQFSNDRGYRNNFEFYTPDFAGALGWTGGQVRALAFHDSGTLARNSVRGADHPGWSVDSIGLGLRLQTRVNFSGRLDYAYVLHDGGRTADKPDGRRGSTTLHASVLWVF
jgi:hemolysin activation/secretion protein